MTLLHMKHDVKKNEAYFRAAWKNAVALCVFLCKEYGLTEKDIIGHVEGHRQVIASNHADPLHWFPKHGESMNTFRAAVKKSLEGDKKPSPSPSQNLYRVQIGAYSVKANAEAQLARAKKAGFSDAFIRYD